MKPDTRDRIGVPTEQEWQDSQDGPPSLAGTAEAFAGWFNQGMYETVSREAGELAYHNKLNRDLRAALSAHEERREAVGKILVWEGSEHEGTAGYWWYSIHPEGIRGPEYGRTLPFRSEQEAWSAALARLRELDR